MGEIRKDTMEDRMLQCSTLGQPMAGPWEVQGIDDLLWVLRLAEWEPSWSSVFLSHHRRINMHFQHPALVVYWSGMLQCFVNSVCFVLTGEVVLSESFWARVLHISLLKPGPSPHTWTTDEAGGVGVVCFSPAWIACWWQLNLGFLTSEKLHARQLNDYLHVRAYTEGLDWF